MQGTDGIELPQLPFFTREMLKFGKEANFELLIRSNQTTQRTLIVRGFTRSGVVSIRHVGDSITTLTETSHGIDDIPIFLAVTPLATANTHGDLYVSVSLRINGDLTIPLVSGFVTGIKGISWPNTNLQDVIPGRGMTESLQITPPAAGNNVSFTIPSNRVLKLRSLVFKLTTDATVASRNVLVEMVHLGTGSIFMGTLPLHLASLVRDYTFAPFGAQTNVIFNGKIFGAMPNDLWLASEDTLTIIVNNIQAGDVFSAIALNVEQFFE